MASISLSSPLKKTATTHGQRKHLNFSFRSSLKIKSFSANDGNDENKQDMKFSQFLNLKKMCTRCCHVDISETTCAIKLRALATHIDVSSSTLNSEMHKMFKFPLPEVLCQTVNVLIFPRTKTALIETCWNRGKEFQQFLTATNQTNRQLKMCRKSEDRNRFCS